MTEPDILKLGPYLQMEGIVYKRRSSLWIPREPETFPDYGKGRCVYCGEKLRGKKRKYCCENHEILYRNARKKYYYYFWITLQRAIVKRDGKKCMACKSQKELNVHHIFPIAFGGMEFDAENCITLCKECHKKAHEELRK